MDGLAARLERLEALLADRGLCELKGMLRRRGLELFRFNPQTRLFFPAAAGEEERRRFYELLKKYSFRLFLREALSRRSSFRAAEVARYASPEVGRRYLAALRSLGLAERCGARAYRLAESVPVDLGPTLEWFLAEIFRSEFFCPALYGLRCKGTRFGGDFDVVSVLESRLVYMEVKSSPPKNIEGGEVREFIARLTEIKPHVAFFFVDTELRLKDKIVPLFEAETAAGRPAPEDAGGAEKIGDEIFFLKPALYLFGSRRSIAANLGTCLGHFLSAPVEPGLPPWPPPGGAA